MMLRGEGTLVDLDAVTASVAVARLSYWNGFSSGTQQGPVRTGSGDHQVPAGPPRPPAPGAVHTQTAKAAARRPAIVTVASARAVRRIRHVWEGEHGSLLPTSSTCRRLGCSPMFSAALWG